MAEQKDPSLDSSWHLRASVSVLYCLPNLMKTLWLSVARHGNHNWHSKVSNLPRATQSQSGRTRINTRVYLGLQTKHAFLFYSKLKPRLLYEIGVRISSIPEWDCTWESTYSEPGTKDRGSNVSWISSSRNQAHPLSEFCYTTLSLSTEKKQTCINMGIIL